MTDIGFPERENLSPEEQTESQNSAKFELRAKYLGDVATFRADIAQMFSGFRDIKGMSRWAYFMLSPGSFCNKNGHDEPTSREAAIAMEWPYRSVNANVVYPTIRFVTNETIAANPACVGVLTQDITINSGSQAHMYVDAFSVDPTGLNFKRSKAPCLGVTPGNSLIVRNLPYITPSPSVVEAVYREEVEGQLTAEGVIARPFGNRGSIGDCIYALGKAVELLNEMKGLEPQALGGKSTMTAFPC